MRTDCHTKKTQSLQNVKEEVAVSAAELMTAFEKDSAAANRQYLGKVVAVVGNIKNIEKEPGVIVFGIDGSTSSVRCSLDSNSLKALTILKITDTVTVKGICIGFNADEFGLGSDVILNRCVIANGK